MTDGMAQRKAFVGAAGANAQGIAMGKDPAVKIRRQLALVIHIAAAGVIAGGLDRRGFDDLMVSEHILGVCGAIDLSLAGHL